MIYFSCYPPLNSEPFFTYPVFLKLDDTILEVTYNKHLLVFLAPNIIFIGQLEKDIGRCVSGVQYLSPADQYHISCEEDQ